MVRLRSFLLLVDHKTSSFLRAYAEIFFLHGKWPGLLILGITCINPQMAIAGVLALVSAFLFASFMGYRQIFLHSGFYTYNTVLIGFSIGATFSLNWVTLLLLVSVSVLSFVFSVFLANVFFVSFRLPILSIPFVVVTSVIYLAAGTYTNLYVSGLYTRSAFFGFEMLHPVVTAFFKSLGSIVFLPDVRAGILLALLLLWHSRILFFLAILGFGAGGLAHGIYVGSIPIAMQDPSSFNYILIAMAIGGVFLIPSIQSVLMALVGVLIATVLIDAVNVFWTQFAIPVFTLPFTVVTLLFVYVLNLIDHPLCTRVFKETPEKIRDYYLTTAHRFCKEFSVEVPFFGTWTVWQGFDGPWTHKGLWRYAYDFVQMGSDGLTYQNEGLRLADYWGYRQPVHSPVHGRVVWVIRHVPDNPIGTVDRVNHWGNMVMIYDARGFYVVMAHFAENAIVVNEGDWVAPGTFLGECGNSGYSQQPHIHMHLQWTMAISSLTIPFRFLGYELKGVLGEIFDTQAIPKEGDGVTHLPHNFLWEQVCDFTLGEPLDFDAFKNDRKRGTFSMKVEMGVDGSFYWETKTAKLHFGKWGPAWFCFQMEGEDAYLRMIYLALPKMPLMGKPGVQWQDTLPDTIALTGWRRVVSGILGMFAPTCVGAVGTYRFTAPTEISGTVGHLLGGAQTTAITLDPVLKIVFVRVGAWELRRQRLK
jgi:urea transporter